MSEAYIIDACRTPRGIGKQGKGSLAHLHPQHLGSTVLKALQERNGFDTADVDNDLVPELYIGQITGRRPNQPMHFLETHEVCDQHSDSAWKERCRKRFDAHAVLRDARRQADASVCLSIQDPSDRGDCVAYVLLRDSLRKPDASACDRIPAHWERLAFICRASFSTPSAAPAPAEEDLRQVLNRNILLVRRPDGTFKDRAKAFGIEVGGWTWNAKFADFDNDEWQDLYIANGFFGSKRRESNLYYRNLAGERFEAGAGAGPVGEVGDALGAHARAAGEVMDRLPVLGGREDLGGEAGGQVGGEALVGPARTMAPGTFWSGLAAAD